MKRLLDSVRVAAKYDCPRVRFDMAMSKLELKHKRNVERLRAEIKAERNKCSHGKTHFHANQYDSWTECLICGVDMADI